MQPGVVLLEPTNTTFAEHGQNWMIDFRLIGGNKCTIGLPAFPQNIFKARIFHRDFCRVCWDFTPVSFVQFSLGYLFSAHHCRCKNSWKIRGFNQTHLIGFLQAVMSVNLLFGSGSVVGEEEEEDGYRIWKLTIQAGGARSRCADGGLYRPQTSF